MLRVAGLTMGYEALVMPTSEEDLTNRRPISIIAFVQYLIAKRAARFRC